MTIQYTVKKLRKAKRQIEPLTQREVILVINKLAKISRQQYELLAQCRDSLPTHFNR